MRTLSLPSLLLSLAVAAACAAPTIAPEAAMTQKLPAPDRQGTRPLEALLQERRSVRAFAPDTLEESQLGQLLWATGGVTQTRDFAHRTVPSAGALYPLELYLLTARGVAHYDAMAHALTWLQERDRRGDLAQAALDQASIQEAPAVIVVAAEPGRTARKYGERAERYVFMEGGHACQNLLLEATALRLGAVPIGAFDDERAGRVLDLSVGRRVLLLVPVGRARQGG
jgi:SagB-type dehydrogenase family enzyme